MSSNYEGLRAQRRSNYPFFLSYRTRWSDNDQYSHINNSIYSHLFDSVVNTYLIERCELSSDSAQIGLVVSSHCQFFSPLSFPQVLDLGLRVVKLGTSSVTYEIAVFDQGSDVPAVVGGYTHVFVERGSRKSVPMTMTLRKGLSQLSSAKESLESKL